MPTLRALECFVAVLDHGSITAAAARLHLSQPALSHQLAALEREVGTALLERLPRGVWPTTAGRAIEADARDALVSAEAVIRVGRAVAAGSGGRVRVACAESLTTPLLAPVLAGWLGRHASVSVELTELSSADTIAEAVRDGRADVGLGPRPTLWEGRAVLVGREEVVLVAPPGHPLTEPGCERSWSEVAQHVVVGFTAGNGLAAWLDELAVAAGAPLAAAVRARAASSAVALAAAGMGVAVVPASAVPASSGGIVLALDPPVERDVVVLSRTGQDALARDLADAIVAHGVPARPM